MNDMSKIAILPGDGIGPEIVREAVKVLRALELPLEMQAGALEARGADWGDQRMRYLSLPAGTDFRPLLEGLPGDVCQCPHWGIVLEGSITVRYTDGREETTTAGQLYHWPAGHTVRVEEAAELVMFSPAAEHLAVMNHMNEVLATIPA